MRYTFGTGDIAAQRLESIAAFFNPGALALIRKYAKPPVKTALDLGCGPGFTTAMLASISEKAYGLDTSDNFLKLASAKFKACEFIKYNVTVTPFPVRADLIYARFLLSHLKDPVGLINRWVMGLNPGGILFVEETEAVESELPLFQKYLEVNRRLVASQGTELFIGSALGEGKYQGDLRLNDCRELPVPDRTAAVWFYLERDLDLGERAVCPGKRAGSGPEKDRGRIETDHGDRRSDLQRMEATPDRHRKQWILAGDLLIMCSHGLIVVRVCCEL